MTQLLKYKFIEWISDDRVTVHFIFALEISNRYQRLMSLVELLIIVCYIISCFLGYHMFSNESLLYGGEVCLWAEYVDDDGIMPRLWWVLSDIILLMTGNVCSVTCVRWHFIWRLNKYQTLHVFDF